ncbi:transglutaminase-like domain-containing protein [Galbibacter mesophilus]|uniref:transglutaminase-like domain-containing protein n=1 Tax=Galbibacter mesophilus TaxID=379069 RepID=UPI00191E11AE|nr:transglutaminase family protein [Galbibacter mesophilus]MCM5663589.1 transglutaminase family protein [Galbibacter mesophilus]
MNLEYTVRYHARNQYETLVKSAVWQFLIQPENNDNQTVLDAHFSSSVDGRVDPTINGLGFEAIRYSVDIPFNEINFEASYKVIKEPINPFDLLHQERKKDMEVFNTLKFKADFEPYLRVTPLTQISDKSTFTFNAETSTFNQLQELNSWVYNYIEFQAGVTSVQTTASKVLSLGRGVCQDFTHLFCAICRANGIPSRYVSGYLHQGLGYSGDAQLHAWAESYLPKVGWVGFDPTNNLLTNQDHIKICHGKDYQDCAPLKGVIYAVGNGNNSTEHTVQVSAQQ